MTLRLSDFQGSTPQIEALFSDAAIVAAALRLEAALAAAQGVEIRTDIDAAGLAEAAAHAGTLAIPLVERLRRSSPDAHRGATSQDVADTVLALQGRAAVGLVQAEAERIVRTLTTLGERHGDRPLMGRTLLQPAEPIRLGQRVEQWRLGVEGALQRLQREADGALVLQLGGPVGSGLAEAETVARTLGLPCPDRPWHARREAVAGFGAALGIFIGALGKIARDISLMAQPEIGEAFEPRVEGRGGSSAMGHKRNPTGCQVVLSAALRAPGLVSTLLSALPQEQERGLGGWQAEGPVVIELFGLGHAAATALAPVLEGLEVP